MSDLLDQPANKPEPGAVTVSTSTDLIVPSALVPAVIFAKGGADDILKQLRDMVATVKTDISTPKGRAAVKSLAYKIARTKTGLDDMGKDLSDKLRAQIDPILEERRKIREGCDALKDQVAAPLDAWEAMEAERIQKHEYALAGISAHSCFSEPLTSVGIRKRIAELDELVIAPANWREFIQRAIDAKESARATLVEMLDETVAHEAAEAETARLAAEQEAARIEQERIDREAREADIARRAAEEAKRVAEEEAARHAEAARIAAEAEAARIAEEARIERERIQREADAAAEAARVEAVRVAEEAAAERQRIQDEAAAAATLARRIQEELEAEQKRLNDEAAAAERQRIADAEAAEARAEAAARRAEQEKAAAVQAERDQQAAELRRQEADRQRREADKKHKAQVNTRAVGGLISYGGLTEEQARAVVTAIAKGQVPGVTISY